MYLPITVSISLPRTLTLLSGCSIAHGGHKNKFMYMYTPTAPKSLKRMVVSSRSKCQTYQNGYCDINKTIALCETWDNVTILDVFQNLPAYISHLYVNVTSNAEEFEDTDFSSYRNLQELVIRSARGSQICSYNMTIRNRISQYSLGNQTCRM